MAQKVEWEASVGRNSKFRATGGGIIEPWASTRKRSALDRLETSLPPSQATRRDKWKQTLPAYDERVVPFSIVSQYKPQLEYMDRLQYGKLEMAQQGAASFSEIDLRANASAATQALTVGKKKEAGRGGAIKRGQREAGHGGGWCDPPPYPLPILVVLALGPLSPGRAACRTHNAKDDLGDTFVKEAISYTVEVLGEPL